MVISHNINLLSSLLTDQNSPEINPLLGKPLVILCRYCLVGQLLLLLLLIRLLALHNSACASHNAVQCYLKGRVQIAVQQWDGLLLMIAP